METAWSCQSMAQTTTGVYKGQSLSAPQKTHCYHVTKGGALPKQPYSWHAHSGGSSTSTSSGSAQVPAGGPHMEQGLKSEHCPGIYVIQGFMPLLAALKSQCLQHIRAEYCPDWGRSGASSCGLCQMGHSEAEPVYQLIL